MSFCWLFWTYLNDASCLVPQDRLLDGMFLIDLFLLLPVFLYSSFEISTSWALPLVKSGIDPYIHRKQWTNWQSSSPDSGRWILSSFRCFGDPKWIQFHLRCDHTTWCFFKKHALLSWEKYIALLTYAEKMDKESSNSASDLELRLESSSHALIFSLSSLKRGSIVDCNCAVAFFRLCRTRVDYKVPCVHITPQASYEPGCRGNFKYPEQKFKVSKHVFP